MGKTNRGLNYERDREHIKSKQLARGGDLN